MKKEIVRSVICLGVASLIGSGSLAQDTSPSNPNQNQPNQPGRSQAPGSSATSPSYRAGQSDQSGHYSSQQAGQLLRFNQLIGANVQSMQGSTIGQVRDLAVDAQSGRIEFALLSLSNTGGASVGNGALSSDTSRSNIGTSRSATTDPSRPNADASSAERQRSPAIDATSSTDRSSTAGSGINPNLGGISGSANSSMGRLLAVPWQLFRTSMGYGSSAASRATTSTDAAGNAASGAPTALASRGVPTLVLNADQAKLQTAPAFDESSFNEMNQGAFGQRVYAHYGLDWNNRMNSSVGGTGSGISTGTGTGSDSRLDRSRSSSDSSSSRPGSTTPDRSSPGAGTSGAGSSTPK